MSVSINNSAVNNFCGFEKVKDPATGFEKTTLGCSRSVKKEQTQRDESFGFGRPLLYGQPSVHNNHKPSSIAKEVAKCSLVGGLLFGVPGMFIGSAVATKNIDKKL